MNLQIVDLVVRSRYFAGCDWGAGPIVLARAGTREVWWRPGSRYWSSTMNPSAYSPTSINLVDMNDPLGNRMIHEGGRLSFKVIEQHRKEIDEWLGCKDVSAAGRISPKRAHTVEVFA